MLRRSIRASDASFLIKSTDVKRQRSIFEIPLESFNLFLCGCEQCRSVAALHSPRGGGALPWRPAPSLPSPTEKLLKGAEDTVEFEAAALSRRDLRMWLVLINVKQFYCSASNRDRRWRGGAGWGGKGRDRRVFFHLLRSRRR